MQNEFLFENTIELFFEACALRIREKIKETNKSLNKIYSNDQKLISHIQNNKRYQNKNRYLLTDTVIGLNQTEGLAPVLFNNDIHTLLWGTDEEIIQNLPTIFHCIIKDLLERHPKNNIDIHFILSDYAPYSFNLTYYNIFKKNNVAVSDYSYGVIPSKIYSELPISRREAIGFLYKKCEEAFKDIFFEFTKRTESYLKIDKIFEKNFIDSDFIPLLKKYIPQEDSIGLRIQHLILADISKSSKLITQCSNQNPFSELDRKLVGLSSKYAYDLMNLQKEYLPLFIEKYSR